MGKTEFDHKIPILDIFLKNSIKGGFFVIDHLLLS